MPGPLNLEDVSLYPNSEVQAVGPVPGALLAKIILNMLFHPQPLDLPWPRGYARYFLRPFDAHTVAWRAREYDKMLRRHERPVTIKWDE
jgi:hypothetical protein